MLIFLPKILQIIKSASADTPEQSEEDKLKEEQDQDLRDEKGAVGNTVDFLLGEGAVENLKTELLRDAITGKTQDELRIDNLNKLASDKLGSQVTFPEDTIIKKDGTITSSTSPTFVLSPEDIIAIRNAQMKEKEKDSSFQLTTSFDRAERITRFA